MNFERNLIFGVFALMLVCIGGGYYALSKTFAPQAAPTKPDFTAMTHQLETLKLQQLEIMAQLKLQNGLLLQELAGDIEEKVR